MNIQTEMLQTFFKSEDYCILMIYRYLNRKLINNYFELDSKFLSFFFDYSKNQDKNMFKSLWGENSIQKDIFIFSEELYKYLEKNENVNKENFFKEMGYKLENSALKTVFPKYFEELYNYYLILYKNQLNKNKHTYKDDNFEIYFFEKISDIKLSEKYNRQNINFYIILDGLIKYKHKIFGGRDVVYSNVSLLEKDFKVITPRYSIIIFVLKKNFLEQLDLRFEEDILGKFKLYNLKILEPILTWENITPENYIKFFQIALYLNERINCDKIPLLDLKFKSYKSKIIKIVKENITFSEKEIIEKLLLELDISISKLYKIFANIFFTTPNRYIMRIKLSKSYFLLANTNDTIESIGEKIGYSPKSFKEKFITRTGFSPIDFRKMTEEK